MPNIIIREIDETRPGESAVMSDIVYVIGFADTNAGCYIFDTAGTAPTEDTKGTPVTSENNATYHTHPEPYPYYACNIIDKITWKCIGFSEGTEKTTWEKMETFIAPAPENAPTLCTTLGEFERAFGAKPYKWDNEESYYNTFIENWDTAESDSHFKFRTRYPSFESDATPNNEHYAYNKNDYEKSYIYAKELINLGLPVVYKNVVERVEGAKTLPVVYYLYTQMYDSFEELLDKNEYDVKYLTTGAYPTFELKEEQEVNSIKTITHSTTPIEVITKPEFTPTRVIITFTNEGTSTTQGYTVFGTIEDDDYISKIEVTKGKVTITAKADAWDSAEVISIGEFDPGFKGLTQKAVDTALNRNDCVAIIDHTDNPTRKLIGDGSIFNTVNTVNESKLYNTEFAAMFTPHATYMTVAQGFGVPAIQVMPASFGYLLALAKSIRVNPNWLAVAGVQRGRVPYIQSLNTTQKMSLTLANDFQKRTGVALNPIVNVKPYGLSVWGNRTMKDNIENLVATSFLNIRNMVSDVTKLAYNTAKSLMFEQNSNVLWINFKSGLTPLLDKLMSGQGLADYKIIRGTTTEKAKLIANIKLYPLYATEDFEITVTLSDEDVNVTLS